MGYNLQEYVHTSGQGITMRCVHVGILYMVGYMCHVSMCICVCGVWWGISVLCIWCGVPVYASVLYLHDVCVYCLWWCVSMVYVRVHLWSEYMYVVWYNFIVIVCVCIYAVFCICVCYGVVCFLWLMYVYLHACVVVEHICGISVGWDILAWHVGSVYTCVYSPGLVLFPGLRRVL